MKSVDSPKWKSFYLGKDAPREIVFPRRVFDQVISDQRLKFWDNILINLIISNFS